METSKSTTPRVRPTTGEILQDGRIIDLVAAPDHGGLELLLSDGQNKPLIVPAFDCDGSIYQPAEVDPGVREAVRFPTGAVEYGTFGDLFRKISRLLTELLALPEGLAALATCWTFSTWILELMLIPTTLVVTGGRLRQVCNLFRLLGAVCRRALLVGELSRHLPFSLNPTLLINDPRLSAPKWAWWEAANCHGVHIASGGTLRSLVCSRAVVLPPGKFPGARNAEAMFLALPPIESPPVTERTLADIASEVQPQTQMFRLDQLRRANPSLAPTHPLAKFELARHLARCIPDDPDIVRVLYPLLASHQQDIAAQHSRDPRVAILEALWGPSHNQDEISVAEIAKRANAILRSRGADYDYNVREMGWKLRGLQLCTTSTGKYKVLRFPGENRYAIHRCVREFGLQLPFREDCEDCKGSLATEQKAVE